MGGGGEGIRRFGGSLSPNAVVLVVFVGLASVDLFVVQVFEEFGYALAYDDEDG